MAGQSAETFLKYEEKSKFFADLFNMLSVDYTRFTRRHLGTIREINL